MALFACKGGDKSELVPNVTVPGSAAASAAPVVSVQPVPSAAPALAHHALAHFDGDELLECLDFDVAPEKSDKLKDAFGDAGANATWINQTCDSLGKTELGSCDQKKGDHGMVQHVYDQDMVASEMKGCLKRGGKWTTNDSVHADAERARQDLRKLERHTR